MSDTKHTTGPWHISDNGNDMRPEAIHGGPHNAILATTWSVVKDAEREANARLIAASPNLLGRLDSSHRTLTAAPDLPDDWPSEDAVEAFAEIYRRWTEDRDREITANRATIAKAKP